MRAEIAVDEDLVAMLVAELEGDADDLFGLAGRFVNDAFSDVLDYGGHCGQSRRLGGSVVYGTGSLKDRAAERKMLAKRQDR